MPLVPLVRSLRFLRYALPRYSGQTGLPRYSRLCLTASSFAKASDFVLRTSTDKSEDKSPGTVLRYALRATQDKSEEKKYSPPFVVSVFRMRSMRKMYRIHERCNQSLLVMPRVIDLYLKSLLFINE